MTEAEWLATRHKLRVGGAAIVPLHISEVIHAADRSRKAVSAEMRAIQESIDLARVAEVPSFPREIQWFANTSMALKAAVIQIWKSQQDFNLAARLSNLVMSLVPKPQDWISRWEAGPPPEWVEAVNRVIVASLAMPIELADQKTETAYNDWVEQNYLEPMRSVWPDRYRAVVEQARSFILNAEDDDDQKEEGTRKPPRKAKKPAPKASRKGKAKRKGRA